MILSRKTHHRFRSVRSFAYLIIGGTNKIKALILSYGYQHALFFFKVLMGYPIVLGTSAKLLLNLEKNLMKK
jgi:hypothetical protein